MPRQVVTRRDCEVAAANASLAATAGDSTGGDNEQTLLISAAARAAVSDVLPDGYMDRFLKYIPSEVIVVYITLVGTIGAEYDAGTASHSRLLWAVYVACQLATPVFLYKVGKVQKREQLAIATVSFFFWAAAFGGPFEGLAEFERFYAAILLPIYTFAVAMYEANS